METPKTVHELLIQIDTENERMFGPIRFPASRSQYLYMNLLQNRRMKHPLYANVLKLRGTAALR
jgi:hypothetical protein